MENKYNKHKTELLESLVGAAYSKTKQKKVGKKTYYWVKNTWVGEDLFNYLCEQAPKMKDEEDE